jgi:hypothetical protein
MSVSPAERHGIAGASRGFACALALGAGLAGCGRSDLERLADARQELADAAWADAVASADAGLRTASDARASWGLELVKLEALARAGEADGALEQLGRISRLYPERVPPTQFSATAWQLRAAGQGPAAIQVLDMGLDRFPEDAALRRLIEDAGSSDVDPAELEMLKSLGYID